MQTTTNQAQTEPIYVSPPRKHAKPKQGKSDRSRSLDENARNRETVPPPVTFTVTPPRSNKKKQNAEADFVHLSNANGVRGKQRVKVNTTSYIPSVTKRDDLEGILFNPFQNRFPY